MKKRADGRYVKVITDPKTKKRISFYGNTVRELNQKLLSYERKQSDGKTFGEVADEWWSEHYDTLAHQSLRGYKPALARALKEFGNDYVRDIKYDVEGSEKEALLGSRKTIEAYRPTLLVSLYHRSEDLFLLPKLVKALGPSYALYLRKLPYIPAWDLNLYAIERKNHV